MNWSVILTHQKDFPDTNSSDNHLKKKPEVSRLQNSSILKYMFYQFAALFQQVIKARLNIKKDFTKKKGRTMYVPNFKVFFLIDASEH